MNSVPFTAQASPSRVCVVTAGHLATSPRMLKVADALADAGYSVRVVSTTHVDWAVSADQSIRDNRGEKWSWVTVDYSRSGSAASRIYTSVRTRAARRVSGWLGAERISRGIVSRARERVFPELARAASEQPADLIYGGGSALSAAAEAARRLRIPFAFDLEDFHSGEFPDTPDGRLATSLTQRLETDLLPRAALLTAGSKSISEAYHRVYGFHPVTINNTFPLPANAPDLGISHGPLRLYWFSQTIGSGRGLEDVIAAVGIADISAELHLRGRPIAGYVDSLNRLASQVAPSLRIVIHEPGEPDSMVDFCREFDVGLAVEDNRTMNRDLCLTNKALTYVLGGLALVLSATTEQRAFAQTLGDGGKLYEPRDIDALASILSYWSKDREALLQARKASWRSAQERWNWDHPEERDQLLKAVQNVLPLQRPNRTSST